MSKFDSHKRLESKYSPDQERDEHGRFGSGGGEGSMHKEARSAAAAGGDMTARSRTSVANHASFAAGMGIESHKNAATLHTEAAAANRSAAQYTRDATRSASHTTAAKLHESIAAYHTRKATK
jgi:hypothetical protein